MCQRLFFIKLQASALWRRFFPVNFAKFLRTFFLQNFSRWLLLNLVKNLAVNFVNNSTNSVGLNCKFVRHFCSCYLFLESLLIGEQNKHDHFFSGSGTFYRPEWKSAQNHKNLNISETTNSITMKLYTIIVLRKTNFLQEISRPEILHTLIYGPEWKSRFWSVKFSEIIFCDPNSVRKMTS